MKKVLLWLLLSGFISFSYGQDIGLKSFSIRAGLIIPEEPWQSGMQIGAAANVGDIINNISLSPFMEYGFFSKDLNGVDTDLTNFKIGLAGFYHPKQIDGLYLGSGLSLNFINKETETVRILNITFPGDSKSLTKPGVGLITGYNFQFSNTHADIRGEYNFMRINTFFISLGVIFNLNNK